MGQRVLHWIGLGTLIRSLLTVAAVLPLGAAWAQEHEPAVFGEPGDAYPGLQRVWIWGVKSLESGRIRLDVQYPDVLAPHETAVFHCEIHAESAVGIGTARMQVVNASGRVIHEGTAQVALGQGVMPCNFSWATEPLPDGDFTVRFDFHLTPEVPLAWEELALTKISQREMAAGVGRATKALEEVDRYIESRGSELLPSPHLDMRWALAKDYFDRIPELGDNWPLVQATTRFVVQVADAVRSQITFKNFAPLNDFDVSPALVTPLEVRNGAYVFGERPVFLFGIRSQEMSAEDIDRLKRYHLNFAAMDVPYARQAFSEADLRDKLNPVFEAAQRNGVSLSLLLDAYDGVVSDGQAQPPISLGRAEAIARRRLDTVAAYLASQTGSVSLGLRVGPALPAKSEEVQGEFIDYVKTLYSDRYAMNRAWRTRYANFEEIDILPEFNRSAYQYDWQTYFRNKTSGFYGRLAAGAAETGFGPGTHLVFGVDAFQPGETRDGVEHETFAKMTPVSAVSIPPRALSEQYAIDFPFYSALYALRRSFAPGTPLISHSTLAIPLSLKASSNGNMKGYTLSTVWEAAIEGVSALTIEGWNEATPGLDSFFGYPALFDGFSTAAIDINRLAPIVAAFQRVIPNTSILWSDSAKIYDDGGAFLGSALRAYEGSSFAGRKIGFITESQCAAGQLERLDILIIPHTPALSVPAFDALQAYVNSGAQVIRSATPIPYDARGHSRDDSIVYRSDTVLVRGQDSSTEYMHAMDAVMYRNDSPIPRSVNQYGYPLEGVKSRFVEFEGEPYLYLLNLRLGNALVHLTNGYRAGRDLISGNEVTFPRTVPSLQPMLVALDSPAESPRFARQPRERGARESGAIPTVIVTPVPARR